MPEKLTSLAKIVDFPNYLLTMWRLVARTLLLPQVVSPSRENLMTASDKNQNQSVHIDGGMNGNVHMAGRDVNITYVQQYTGLATSGKTALHQLPPNYISRGEELAELKALILIQPSHPIVTICGMGGIGKSVLALALCHEEDVQQAFPDGIIWVMVGNEPGDMQKQVEAIGLALGDVVDQYQSFQAGINRLHVVLSDKKALLILDDVWEYQYIKHFRFSAPGCKVLCTTRNTKLASLLGAAELKLGVLKPTDGINLLEKISGRSEPEYDEIARRLGYLPLALEIAAARLVDMSGNDWLYRYRERVSQLKLDYNSTDPHENLEACFDLSTTRFPDREQLLYHSLGIFKEALWIPRFIALKLWRSLAPERGEAEFLDLIDALAHLELIELNDSRKAITMHGLLHDYNKNKLGKKEPEIHNVLLCSYNPENHPWHEIPDDNYLYFYLPYHLERAKRQTELYDILLKAPIWTETKLQEPQSALEGLIIRVWIIYWDRYQTRARQFLFDWLAKRERIPESSNYSPKLLVIRCAFHVDCDEVIASALCIPDKRLQSEAITYVYFRTRQDPFVGLWYLERLIRPSRKFGTPNSSVIRMTVALVTILLTENIEDSSYRQQLFSTIRKLVRRTFYADNNIPFGKLIRTAILKTIVKGILPMMQGVKSEERYESSGNIKEWERGFSYDLLERQPVFEAIQYLDPQYGNIIQIVELLPRLRALKNHLFNQILNYAILPRGAISPAEILPVTKQLYDLDYGGNMERLDAIYIWFVCLEYQEEINQEWLMIQKHYANGILQANKYGYGVIKTAVGEYTYYPLMFYASPYSQKFPGQPIDLIDDYLKTAKNTADQALFLHIIDGFADVRFRLADYVGPLQSLMQYIPMNDPEIADHMTSMLARLRSSNPKQIEQFMRITELPYSMRESVRSKSVQASETAMTMRGNHFIRDALLSMSPEGIQVLIRVLDRGFRQNSFYDAIDFTIRHLINALGGDDIFN